MVIRVQASAELAKRMALKDRHSNRWASGMTKAWEEIGIVEEVLEDGVEAQATGGIGDQDSNNDSSGPWLSTCLSALLALLGVVGGKILLRKPVCTL